MVIDTLKDTLARVNDWIKFGEAKNAANIAFCSAGTFMFIRMLVSNSEINLVFASYAVFSIILLSISFLISLLSFVPKLKAPWVSMGNREEKDNLLYFGDAHKYSATQYLSKLYLGRPHNSENYELEEAYAQQIVVNSKIAYIKFKQFDIAIWFTISAIITPLGALFISKMRE
ncbi:hypothetical protein AMEC673_07750 [Alteromonas macleodii str. 'English Channel 673']|uniref:Pycsar effector protein domain-containing protein n=1 Tax=Alteromonas macleodii (strain English Channel 673) TaxID=1004788 RepID=A0AB32ZXK3_ALTME|nr:Pycsar system effector family protein [Alteromonas macleodii]AFT74244.1 hypothetical protein AMEC673_07750 [Alteromonas macleodii str. 'English Channel 673']